MQGRGNKPIRQRIVCPLLHSYPDEKAGIQELWMVRLLLMKALCCPKRGRTWGETKQVLWLTSISVDKGTPCLRKTNCRDPPMSRAFYCVDIRWRDSWTLYIHSRSASSNQIF